MRKSEIDEAQLLSAALPVRVELARRDGSAADEGHDFVVRLPDGTAVPIDLRWAGAGFPRDVEHSLSRPRRAESQLVLVAEQISSGSRRVLAERGISWVAADGTASLEIGPVFVERDLVRPTAEARAGRPASTGWNDSRTAVAEVLLADASRVRSSGDRSAPGVSEIAAISGRSLGGVSAALQSFDQRGWTGKGRHEPEGSADSSAPSRSRRTLVDPSGLLDSWVDRVRERPADWRSFHFLERDVDVVAELLERQFAGRILFTAHWAAGRRVPRLTVVPKLRCWVSDELSWADVSSALESLGGQPAENGRVVVARGGAAVMRSAMPETGPPLAAAPRVYADMGLDDTERGRDAADVYRRKALGF